MLTGRMTDDQRDKLIAWMGPEENTNLDGRNCESWIEDTPDGNLVVVVRLVLKSGDERTLRSDPFATEVEAWAFQLHLHGQEA